MADSLPPVQTRPKSKHSEQIAFERQLREQHGVTPSKARQLFREFRRTTQAQEQAAAAVKSGIPKIQTTVIQSGNPQALADAKTGADTEAPPGQVLSVVAIEGIAYNALIPATVLNRITQ